MDETDPDAGPSWDQLLQQRYPLLYRKPIEFMCWPGWAGILEQVSERIEAELRELRSQGTRLQSLPYAFQVKEKFAELRFYLQGSATPAMRDAIEQARQQSLRTCERCGEPGQVRQGIIFDTLCDAHAQGRPPIAPEELPYTGMQISVGARGKIVGIRHVSGQPPPLADEPDQ